jgi:hypothetical protein
MSMLETNRLGEEIYRDGKWVADWKPEKATAALVR